MLIDGINGKELNLDHENILKCYHYGEMIYQKPDKNDRKVFCIVTEHAEIGNLLDQLNTYDRMVEEVARYFFKQIVEGLIEMKVKNATHRDIKPENILLSRDYKIKIADFGLTSSKDFMTTHCGTPGFMAPEFFE